MLRDIIFVMSQETYGLYKTYSQKILNYLTKRLPERADAEEIMQDVFFEAIDSLPLFRGEATVLSWLYKIARNKVADFYRKRRIKTILFSQLPFLELASQEIHQPEFQFEKNRIRARIEWTFYLIPSHYQKILRLHYENGIRVKDLAPIFNLSYKAAESLLFRARRSFRRAYERA